MKKYVVIVLFLLPVFTQAETASLELCQSASQSVNKTLPMKKDNFTIVRETGCLSGKPKNIFLHILEVNAPIELVRQIKFEEEMKPSVLNTYCTDPKVRPVLNAFDIDYRYYTKNGEFAGSFLMKSKECK